MADPNTQIDWWIAQAWQETQGGADNDSLVTWLHENGLTAVSSYLILQAALSCPPDEAKEIVFSHPVWAGEEPDAELEDAAYTSETLEPEPEPDPSFELDDWADQIEEGAPVYGEEGYQFDPAAGAARTDLERSGAGAPEDGMPTEPEPASEAPNGHDQAGAPGLADAFDAGSGEPAAPAFQLSPMSADEITADPDTAAEFRSEPAMDAPDTPVATPPPILRTPPTTPAERAARFAHAIGKQPADAESPAPDVHSATRQRTEPPSSNAGPAVEAETAPARYAPEQPQTVPAGVQMPPPLVYQPLPEIETPPAIPPADPLFTSAPREPDPGPPVFEPGEAGESDIGVVPDEPAEPDIDEVPDDMAPEIPAEIDHDGDRPPDLRASPEDRMVGPEYREPDENAVAALSFDDEAADASPRPPKKVLLDPSEEAGGDGPGAEGLGDMPLGGTPAELAEAARRLGINFRGSSAADAGIDPESARTAKELGISFRDDAVPGEAELNEAAIEAQKLGINFRDGGAGSDGPGKPLIVKYMPLFLGAIILVFLLLLGVTFSGDLVGWFKS